MGIDCGMDSGIVVGVWIKRLRTAESVLLLEACHTAADLGPADGVLVDTDIFPVTRFP